MDIYIGANKINEIYIGTSQISEVWIGSNQVWARTFYLPETGFNNYSDSGFNNEGSNLTNGITITRDVTLKVEVSGSVGSSAHFSLERKTNSSSNWPTAGTSYSTKWSSGSYTNNAKTLSCIVGNVLRFNGYLAAQSTDIDVTVVVKNNADNQVLDTFTYFVEDLFNYTGGGGGSYGCFPGDSWVSMEDLSTKRISEIEAGDKVIGDNGIINEVIELRTIEEGERPIFKINHLKTTPAHPIKTSEGWKAIDPEAAMYVHPEMTITELKVGDMIVRVNDEGNEYQEEVTSIDLEVTTDPVYNLNVSGSDTPEINGNDTYVVDGVVVHNK